MRPGISAPIGDHRGLQFQTARIAGHAPEKALPLSSGQRRCAMIGIKLSQIQVRTGQPVGNPQRQLKLAFRINCIADSAISPAQHSGAPPHTGNDVGLHGSKR